MQANWRDEWCNSVDERLVNLNSAQGTTDLELATVEKELDKLDKILRGDPETHSLGILADLDKMDIQIRKFNAILEPDSLGNGGLRGDIKFLLGKRTRSEKREGYIWAFFTAVIVQFLILIGLLVVNWDKIQEYIVLRQHIHDAASVERDTKKAKAARARKHKAKPAPVPVAEPEVKPEEPAP